MVTGVDLAEPLSTDTQQAIKALLRQHLVLFFRDQSLDAGRLLHVASQFGKPVPYPFVDGLTDYPEVIEVLKLPHERENFGGVWHSDTTYLDHPAMGALLYADEVPAVGGDTLFANMYLAYQALSPALQDMLAPLYAVFDADKSIVAATRQHRQSTTPERQLLAEHPMIRTHPETGNKLLYVSRAHTTRIVGWTENESRELLDYLFELQSQPEITCRFQWQQGSVAFWDNRACQHYPLNDYHGKRRRMLRVSLEGDRPCQ